MDCNRDEAIRSMEIAEMKFKENSFVAAKKLALKAKALFEPLEGIDQMIIAFDVHVRAQTRVGEEKDWYHILEVSTSADEETIRKQYKKMAFRTHPDKNKSIGADGAFKHISDAWSVLSDKHKRMLHDQKRHMSSLRVHQNKSQANVNTTSSSKTSVSGFCNQNSAPVPPYNAQRPSTFWTSCTSCGSRFKYPRQYFCRFMMCTVCQKVFPVLEIPPPNVDTTPVPNGAMPGTGVVSGSSKNDDPRAKDGTCDSSSTCSVQKTHGTVSGSSPRSRSSIPSTTTVPRNVGSAKEKEGAKRSYRRMVFQPESSGLSSDSAKIKPSSATGTSYYKRRKVPSGESSRPCKKNAMELKERAQSSIPVGSEAVKSWEWRKTEVRLVYTRRHLSDEMHVPDADFNSFGDHHGSFFQKDQVWATYDEEDGMPRYYAVICKVHSTHPFKVRLSFLKPDDCNEFGASNWISCGYSKTCGDFKRGSCKYIDKLNAFSHIVTWEKGPGGIIRIFPKKGDIWALYKNWSPGWDEHTLDDTMYKYELVEVVDNYRPSDGISVMPIAKMSGFVSVFKPLHDPTQTRTIPKAEMLRFSHQVPFHVLTGEESQPSLKGCYELDPGSTPKELLQVNPV